MSAPMPESTEAAAAARVPELAEGLPSVLPWVTGPGRWTDGPGSLRASAVLWWLQLLAFGVVAPLLMPTGAQAVVRAAADPIGLVVGQLLLVAGIGFGIWMLLGGSLVVRLILTGWAALEALGALTSIGRESWPQILLTASAAVLMWVPSSNEVFRARWRRYLAYLLPDRRA